MNETSLITALTELFKVAGAGPIAVLIIVIMLAPVMAVLLVMRSNRELRESIQQQQSASEKRFDAVVQMYKDNVDLVKSYEKTADGLMQVIHVSTARITALDTNIKTNRFCPIVRERSTPDGR